jgi:hypothetical protein
LTKERQTLKVLIGEDVAGGLVQRDERVPVVLIGDDRVDEPVGGRDIDGPDHQAGVAPRTSWRAWWELDGPTLVATGKIPRDHLDWLGCVLRGDDGNDGVCGLGELDIGFIGVVGLVSSGRAPCEGL